MRISAAAFVVGLLISFTVSADEYPEMKTMKEFHSEICKEHNNPALCERVVGIMMKSVMQNDDIYIQCLQLSPSQREEDEGCRSAEAIRQMISRFN
ncbi:TPA: hypothetical protein MD906_003800 [Klebsiella aerogenes]|nr:hypothetical protein [Klebsiella aerogenes]